MSSLFYHPDTKAYHQPADFGLTHEEVWFESGDGTRLHGWFLPAEKEPKGTVVHFHGNAGNLTGHFTFVRWLPSRGFNVFIFDYRGYGASEGRPGRYGVVRDGVAALRVVVERPDIDPEKIVVLGQSLGGAVAMATVTDESAPPIQALAVDSTFYSYTSIVRDKVGLIPVLRYLKWPLSYLLVTNSKSPSFCVDEIAPIPFMIFHGTDDRIIPYHHSEKLFRAAGEPKTLVTIEEGRHTVGLMMQDPTYRDALTRFFINALRME